MLPVVLILAGAGLVFYLATSEKDSTAKDPNSSTKAPLGKAGEERLIRGGIADGSLEERLNPAHDEIRDLNRPALEGAGSGATAGLAIGGPIGAAVGFVLGAFAQNLVRFIEGTSVADIVDSHLRSALRDAGVTVNDSNLTYARHLFAIQSYAGELAPSRSNIAGNQGLLAIKYDDGWHVPGPHTPLFTKWVEDYFQKAVVDVQPRSQDNLFGFIPVATNIPIRDGWYVLRVSPGDRRCKFVVRHELDSSSAEAYQDESCVLKDEPAKLTRYAERLAQSWNYTPPTARQTTPRLTSGQVQTIQTFYGRI